MRVVAGQWRGHPLVVPRGSAARPTTDRVKSAMFSILGDRIRDAVVADLCCGSGALGIEALSRGASFAHFVDVSTAALRGAGENLERLGAAGDTYRLRRADAVRWLEKLEPVEDRRLILLTDPPYGGPLPSRIWQLLTSEPLLGMIEAAIVEHDPDTVLDEPEGGGSTVDRRRYGSTCLSILEA